jgi:hypothetical protein
MSSGKAPAADDSQEMSDRAMAVGREDCGTAQLRRRGGRHQQTPAALMQADSQEFLDDIERLDDIVFDAMSGNAGAIEEMGRIWPQLLAKLGPDKLDESREQYLRHSLSVWETCLESGLREPERALASLQVLSILFGEK